MSVAAQYCVGGGSRAGGHSVGCKSRAERLSPLFVGRKRFVSAAPSVFIFVPVAELDRRSP